MTSSQASFLSGPNGPFIEELYCKYLENPAAVDPSWRKFFADLQDEAGAVLQDIRGASWAPRARSVEIGENGHDEAGAAPVGAIQRPAGGDLTRSARDSLRAMMLIRAYRVRGHLEAKLDPLDLKPRHRHSELDPRSYGFTDADMDREIYIDNVFGYQHATLRQIVHAARETYCGSIGVEYMHIENPDQKKWLQARIEGSRNQREFTPDKQEDLDHWSDMMTLNGYPAVHDADGLAATANAVLENYKSHQGKILKTEPVPRTADRPAEHLIVVRFSRSGFVEIAFARFKLGEKKGHSFVYSHRFYGD